ncbi:MAG TPA: class A beta-lactamase [Polyangiaceae bacterium]|nr:class A beta-lactamase [Polyangiaceae bacterium]
MSVNETRRAFLHASLGAALSACAGPRGTVTHAPTEDALRSLRELEAQLGGRLGLFALDTGNGRQLGHRADERFAMCSTFKWLLAASILQQIDRGALLSTGRVPYGEADLLEYAPVTRSHVAEGSMTVEALAEASVTVSDNTAANLLLAHIGGPSGLTRFAQSLGDSTTRLDRTEPSLNTNDSPEDPRDTTTPRAMVGSMQHVLCEGVLSIESRGLLASWLRASTTGLGRLRAGLPADWIVGDKTGTGEHGAVNDVAIAWPPGRAPILIAAYLSESSADIATLNAAHARVGRIVAEALG